MYFDIARGDHNFCSHFVRYKTDMVMTYIFKEYAVSFLNKALSHVRKRLPVMLIINHIHIESELVFLMMIIMEIMSLNTHSDQLNVLLTC